jgi:ADP-heptose:LPS heptosyltransferase
MFFRNKAEKITVNEFDEYRKNICIYRGVGGLGDILAMRMIFEDLKTNYPDFKITWAVPYRFFAAALQHPFVDHVVNLDEAKRKNYLETFDVTTICGRYEVLNKGKAEKNRSDIWANYFGLELKNHNMHMPSYSQFFDILENKLKKLGWDGQKKLIAFAPKSAIGLKNMTFEQMKAIRDFTKDYFLFALHNSPILELGELGIPGLYDLKMEQALCAIERSDYVIATDTGLLHAAAGYKKPALGTFSFVDGYIYCKYYPTVQVVQIHKNDHPGWCGPCWDYGKCPFTEQKNQKPCQTNITPKLLLENWHKLLNKV